MNLTHDRILSWRNFCLCCVGATAFAASGDWLTPRQAFAEARNTVDLIRDSAAKTPIKVYKLLGGVRILEGSGGNIAILTGSDGKVFVDAGITASRPRIIGGCQWSEPRSDHATVQHPLALRRYERQ